MNQEVRTVNGFRLKLLGSIVTVVLLTATLATTAFAAPPTPSPRSNAPGPYGYGYLGGYDLDRVAKILDMTRDDIISQLQQGKSLVQVAQSKNKTEQDLIDVLLAPEKDMIQLRVKYGYLTQEQADYSLQQTTDRIKAAINATGTGSGYGYGYGNGYGWGCGGFGGTMGGFGGMMGRMMGGWGGWGW